MIIENKKLLTLLEKELKIEESLKGAKKEVAELTARMKEIQEENKAELEGSVKLRAKIAKIFIPLVLEKKGEYETFSQPKIVDGKIEVEFTDHKPKTLEAAELDLKQRIAEIDNGWIKHLEK